MDDLAPISGLTQRFPLMLRSAWQRGLAFAFLWWVLAEGRFDSWLLGAPAIIAATGASLRLLPPGKHSIRITGLIGFAHFFLWNSIRGGIQVAALALRGRSALQPGLLELTVMLPPGGPSILLVNVLSLMPGTVGVEMRGKCLRLHLLDERLPVLAEVRALETVIARLFGIST